MKKVLFLFLVLGVGRVFSQTLIYSEDFTTPTFTNSADWGVFAFQSCTVLGSSGGNALVGQMTTNGVELAGTPVVSTSTFINVQVKWNMLINSPNSPAVTFQWLNVSSGVWSTIAYTAPPTPTAAYQGTWAAVPTVTLPVGASLSNIAIRWFYTGTLNFDDLVEIDDVEILGTPVPSYYYKGSGDLSDVNNWSTNTNGVGPPFPVDFTSPSQNFFLLNSAGASLVSPWTVSGAGSIINVGDGTIGGAFNLTIPASDPLTLSGGAKMIVTNSSSLTIANSSFPAASDVTLAVNSTVNWAQTGNVTIWNGAYGNLILSGSGNRSQTNGSPTVVNRNFIIGASTNYVMVAGPLNVTRLSGAITCNGNITGGTSNLTIDGSPLNAIGTLNFNGTNTINSLNLNRATQTLILGSNLSITGSGLQATTLTNGRVNLNGRSLDINGLITFPASISNGYITGSATSSLSIAGSGAITNALIMDQTIANTRRVNLTYSRASSTLSLGSDIQTETLVHTNGVLNINGRSLVLNGPTTFPTLASNGSFLGSTTSSLTTSGGINAFVNPLWMNQTSDASRSLGLFSLGRASTTLTLGNRLIVDGTFNYSNGFLAINGTSLSLSGPIAFPTSTFATRGFIGSSTSSITIDGIGAIAPTGLFVMSQADANSQQLGLFKLNRSGETVIMGNELHTYGDILVSAGTLQSGVGQLYIRSNATNKGRIGPVAGVISGNVRVETFALGGTTGWTNLGPSGISGRTVASWEGQIPMTCTLCPNSPLGAGGVLFNSIQGWDASAAANSPAAYLPLTYTSALNPGAGYWVYLGNGPVTTTNIIWNVNGPVVQGDLPVPLTTAGPSIVDGFNLLSNPYPSPISWTTALASSGASPLVDNAIYVYNPDVLGGETSFSGGVQSDPAGISNTIPVGQGFYVQTSAATTFTFKESSKIAGNAPLLKGNNVADGTIGAVFRLQIENGVSRNMAAIRFHGEATPGYDRNLDARKMFNSPGSPANNKRTSISTKSDGIDFSINSLPYPNNEDAIIPVLAKVGITGQYTISGTDLQNLPNSCVILKDKLTGTQHNLKNGPYVCTISDTTSSPRFELRVCADITLNVDETKGGIVTQSHIVINQDASGASVKFDFDQATKATISVTNILGQKIIENKSLTVSKDVITLNIPDKNQLVFVTVTTADNKVTKKIVR